MITDSQVRSTGHLTTRAPRFASKPTSSNIIRDVFFREVGVVLTVDMIQRDVAEIVRRAAR